jgi:hypothetical protein
MGSPLRISQIPFENKGVDRTSLGPFVTLSSVSCAFSIIKAGFDHIINFQAHQCHDIGTRSWSCRVMIKCAGVGWEWDIVVPIKPFLDMNVNVASGGAIVGGAIKLCLLGVESICISIEEQLTEVAPIIFD